LLKVKLPLFEAILYYQKIPVKPRQARFGFARGSILRRHPVVRLNFKNVVAALLKQLEILNADRPAGFSPRMHHVASPKSA